MATIKPKAVVRRASHMPPANIAGSTLLPDSSNFENAVIIPITVPRRPKRGAIFDITSRGFTPSDDLTDFIHTKLLKLSTFDQNISHVKVVLLKESRAEKVELIVESDKKKYISKGYSSVFEKTFVKSIDNIITQIKKHKSNF